MAKPKPVENVVWEEDVWDDYEEPAAVVPLVKEPVAVVKPVASTPPVQPPAVVQIPEPVVMLVEVPPPLPVTVIEAPTVAVSMPPPLARWDPPQQTPPPLPAQTMAQSTPVAAFVTEPVMPKASFTPPTVAPPPRITPPPAVIVAKPPLSIQATGPSAGSQPYAKTSLPSAGASKTAFPATNRKPARTLAPIFTAETQATPDAVEAKDSVLTELLTSDEPSTTSPPPVTLPPVSKLGRAFAQPPKEAEDNR